MKKSLFLPRQLLVVLLILGIMNFFENGSYFFVFLSLLGLLSIRSIPRSSITLCFFLLLTLSAAISSISYYSFNEVVRSLCYVSMYIVGFDQYSCAKDSALFVRQITTAMYVGSILVIALETIYNYNKVFASNRMLKNIWTGDYISPTFVSLVSLIAIAQSFIWLFFSDNKKLKYVAIASLILSFFISFRTATRFPFLSASIILIMCMIMKISSKSKIRDKFLMIGFIALIALTILLFVRFDIFGIYSNLETSDLFVRFSDYYSYWGRSRIRTMFLSNWTNYLWGGGYISNTLQYYGHDWILDSFDLYGVFALIATAFLTVIAFVQLIRLMMNRKRYEDYLLFIYLLSLIIGCFIEPVFHADPAYVMSFIFMMGIVDKRNCELKAEKSYLIKNKNLEICN